MPALPRVLQKIFGSALTPASNVAQIGSLAAGAPVYSNDLATIQALAQYLNGFNGICVGNRSPAKQDMNALFLLVTQQLAYILQSGVPEYDPTTPYFSGNMLRSGSVGYTSLANNLTGSNPATDSNNWASGLGKMQAGIKTGGLTAVPVDTNGHIIGFNSAISNPYAAFNVGTYKYTAAARGDYQVSSFLQVDNVSGLAASIEFSYRAVINSVTTALAQGTSVANPPGSRWYPSLAGMVTLNAGDTLEFQLAANDGTNTGSVNVSNSACSIQRI